MPARWILVALSLAVVLTAGCDRANKGADEPWVATPALALETLSAKPIFYNAAARNWLVSRRPDLLENDDRGRDSKRADSFAQAVQEPKLFRQLDRQQRFQTLLLVGDPSESRPLL